MKEKIKNLLIMLKSYSRYCKPFIKIVYDLIEHEKKEEFFSKFDEWLFIINCSITIKIHKINWLSINIINDIVKDNTLFNYYSNIELYHDFEPKNKKLIEKSEIISKKLYLYILEIINYNIINNLDKYDELLIIISKTLYNMFIVYFNDIEVNFLGRYFSELFLLYEKIKTGTAKSQMKIILEYSIILICERLRTNNNKIKINHFQKSLRHNQLNNYLKLYLDNIIDNVEFNIALNNKEVDLIIPRNSKEYFKVDYDLNKLKLKNEKNLENGIFGWCIICRNKSNLFCKETRVPICSLKCKFENNNNEHNLNNINNYILKVEKSDIEFNSNFLNLLDVLLNLSFQDLDKKDKNNKNNKIKFIKLFKLIFEKYGKNFCKNLDLILFIKNNFIKKILKIYTYNEKLFKISISILNIIFLNMRIFLKNEIGVILEEIVIKIIDSPNAKFFYKNIILKFIENIMKDKEIPIQLFFNFDCSSKSNTIFQTLLNKIIKISQGKYSLNNVYSNIINKDQERELRILCNRILFNYINGLETFLNIEDIEDNEVLDDEIKKNLQIKEQIENEIYKFNKSGKIKFILNLVKIGAINGTPEGISDFFRDKRLSLISIGKVFGNEDEFSLKILDKFLEKENYKNIELTIALKQFLKNFQLPGESQKVERILNHFSQRFFDENPNTISLDNINSINYLLMFLQTNIYNPNVKIKYELKNFLDMGAEMNIVVDKEILTRYYNFILKEPISEHVSIQKKKEEEENMKRTFKEKQNLFLDETRNIIDKMNTFNDNKTNTIENLESYYNFKDFNDHKIIYLFIDKIWMSIHGFFSSNIIKYSKDEELQNFTKSIISMIKITDKYQFQTEREAFILILVQYSGLSRKGIELNEKNIIFINALENISIKLGNQLHSSWKYILNCFLNLNYYYSLKDRPYDNLNIDFKNCSFIIENLGELNLDRIFWLTRNLNDNSIINFLTGLSELNIEEVNKKDFNKSFYGLNKLLEVIILNKNRNILVKNRIIELIEKTFINIFRIVKNEKNSTMNFINILKNIIIEFLNNSNFNKNNMQLKIFNIFLKISEADYIQIHHLENILICILHLIQKFNININLGYSVILKLINIFINKIIYFSKNEEYDYKFIINIIMNILYLYNEKIEEKIINFYENLNLFSEIYQILINLLDTKGITDLFKYLKNIFDLVFIDNRITDDLKLKIKNNNYGVYKDINAFIKYILFKILLNLINNDNIKNNIYELNLDLFFQVILKYEDHFNEDLFKEFLDIIFNKTLKIQISKLTANDDPSEVVMVKKMIIYTLKTSYNWIFFNNNINLINDLFKIVEDNLKANNSSIDLIVCYIEFLGSCIENTFDSKNKLDIDYLILIFSNHFNNILSFINLDELVNNNCQKFLNIANNPIQYQKIEIDFIILNTSIKIQLILKIYRLIQIIIKNCSNKKIKFKNLFKGLMIVNDFSTKFNEKRVLRYLLWKNGYLSNINSLPSLHVLIKVFKIIEIIKFKNKIINNYTDKKLWNYLDYCNNIFNNYIKKFNELKSIFISKSKNSSIIFEDEIMNKEYHYIVFKENQENLIHFYNFINKQIFSSWNEILDIDKCLSIASIKNKLIELYKIIVKFLFLPNISGNQLFKCFSCSKCVECKNSKINSMDEDEGQKFIDNLFNKLIK